MWVLQIFKLVWNKIFAVVALPSWGVTFGDITILSFLGIALAGYFNMFIHRGE